MQLNTKLLSASSDCIFLSSKVFYGMIKYSYHSHYVVNCLGMERKSSMFILGELFDIVQALVFICMHLILGSLALNNKSSKRKILLDWSPKL